MNTGHEQSSLDLLQMDSLRGERRGILICYGTHGVHVSTDIGSFCS